MFMREKTNTVNVSDPNDSSHKKLTLNFKYEERYTNNHNNLKQNKGKRCLLNSKINYRATILYLQCKNPRRSKNKMVVFFLTYLAAKPDLRTLMFTYSSLSAIIHTSH